jgi:hypothetical protein
VHEHDIKSDSVPFEKEIQEAIDGIKTQSDGIQSTGQVSSNMGWNCEKILLASANYLIWDNDIAIYYRIHR